MKHTSITPTDNDAVNCSTTTEMYSKARRNCSVPQLGFRVNITASTLRILCGHMVQRLQTLYPCLT